MAAVKNDILFHRLIDKASGSYLFTGESAEITYLTAQGWDDDGVAFSLFTAAGSRPVDQVDVIRLYNTSTKDHLYTTDASEATAAAAIGYTNEGVVGRALKPDSSSQNQITVQRYYNRQTGDHYYTDSDSKAATLEAKGYNKEGAAWALPGNYFMSFSGGGWNSQSLLAGTFAGLLDKATGGSSLDNLMQNIRGISANSGGTWFLNLLANSQAYLDGLNTQAGRDSYNTTGYNSQLAAKYQQESFGLKGSEIKTVLENILSNTIGRSKANSVLQKIDQLAAKSFSTGGLDFWDWFAGKINYLGPVIKNQGLNWSDFVEELVYLKGFGSDVYNSALIKKIQEAPLEWAKSIDLTFATAVPTAPTYLGEKTRWLLEDYNTYGRVSPTNPPAWWNQAIAPQILPLSITSSVDLSTNKRSGTATFSSGDVVFNYFDDRTLSTDTALDKVAQTQPANITYAQATIASSAAAGLIASPQTLTTTPIEESDYNAFWALLNNLNIFDSSPLQFKLFLTDILADLTSELAPPAGFSGDTFKMFPANGNPANDDDNGLTEYKSLDFIRLVDGGYADNTSAAYIVREIQTKYGASTPFNLTILMNSNVNYDKEGAVVNVDSQGTKSSFKLTPDTAKLFGYATTYVDPVTGKKTDPAQVSVFDPLTGLGGNVPVPTPTIFDPNAWYGEAPVWTKTLDNGTWQLSSYDLEVVTVENKIYGIQGGQKGNVEIIQLNNSSSIAMPIGPETLAEYNQNYTFAREAFSSEGYKYLFPALGL